MRVLKDLQPKKVFWYFEKICAIPHGSHNTKRLCDYCEQFAQEHLLAYIRDDYNNIILYAPGTVGYENSAPVMIQGHLDMVCEKDADCDIDFEREGLRLEYKDGMISAKGTTLGGDDGIAIAYALAILDSAIPHPPLEVVFTSDEEVGMLGAAKLPFDQLEARTMLNIDSEDEGYLLVSCAGGCRINCMIEFARETKQGVPVTVTVGGLTGGHSGVEIIHGRANANMLLGRLLDELNVPYQLVEVNGGMKDNAIPREAQAKLLTAQEDVAALTDAVKSLEEIYAAENHVTDPELHIITAAAEQPTQLAVITETDTNRIISALRNLPNGVQCMSSSIEGLVQTSLNLGVLRTEGDTVSMTFAVRSSAASELEETVDKIVNVMQSVNGKISRYGDYPAWEYKEDSPLRELMCKVFTEQYGHEPVVHAIHAGVECGLFAGALDGLDCVSFGPDLKDIHTTSERMDVASVQRTWNFLKRVLKELK